MYASEIADELRLDLSLTFEIIDEGLNVVENQRSAGLISHSEKR